MGWNGTFRAGSQQAGARRLAVLGLVVIGCMAIAVPAMAQRAAEVPTFVYVAPGDQTLETCAQALGNVLSPPEAPVRITAEGLRGLGPDIDLGGYSLSPEPCFKASASVGVVNREIGSGIGIGTLPGPPGNEPLFLSHGGRLWGGAAAVDFDVLFPDEGVSFGWTGLYNWGGGRTTRTEPIGGAPVAYTFGEDSFGSTGLFLGATGAEARSDINYSAFGMEADFLMRDIEALRHMYGADVPGDGGRSQWAVGVTGLFNHATLEHTGTFRSLTFPAIQAEVNRTLTSNAFGLGPKFELSHDIGDDWFVTLGADMQAVWRHSTLDSREAITCGPCGGLPPAFDVNVTDSVSGVDWLAGLDIGLSYEVSPAVRFTMGAALDFGGRDTFRVRANPAEPDTGIERIIGADWGLRFGISGRF